MYNKPITSRIKRSPLLKFSPLKSDEKDPKAKVSGSEKGEDITTTETKEKESVGAYRRACGSKTDGSTGTDSDTGKTFKCAQAAKGQEPKETETITTTKKGEDLDYEGKLYAKKEFDVLQPWETRQMSRSIKKEQRDIRRAKEKLDKAKKRGNTSKREEAQAELDQFTAMAERGSKARESGRKTGTSQVYAGQREMDMAELEKGEQKQQALETARKDARQKEAEASKITTSSSSQAAGAVEPGSNPFSNMQFNPDDYQINYTPGTYNLGSGINKMDSPTKKALTGKQYNLPQRLQEKIKAAPESPAKLGPLAAIVGKALIGAAINKLASSNKMKTPLKKGYFKSK